MAAPGEEAPWANTAALGLAELARVKRDIPLPPPGFDALTAADAQLDHYRLPARPDPAVAPQMRVLWDRVFARPRVYVVPELRIRPELLHPLLSAPSGGLSDGAAAVGRRWGSSRNWSGAVIAARDGMLFDRVHASWRVPQAAMPADAAEVLAKPDGLPGGAWKASMWVGLDGYRLCSMSLPQIGTTSVINAAGVARYYLWVQWWVRGKLYGEVEVSNFPVAQDDEITAFLEVTKPDDVGFNVHNHTTGQHVTIVWSTGQITNLQTSTPAGKLQQPVGSVNRSLTPAEGRHAVWCVERPSVMPTDAEILAGIPAHKIRKYRLPKLPEAGFSQALATMRDDVRVVERDLTAARHLRMLMPRADDVVPLCGPQPPARGGNTLVVEPA